MKLEPEFNEWYCRGYQWYKDGSSLQMGLGGVALCGGSKDDIFAFIKGYNSAMTKNDPKPTNTPTCEV